MVSYFDALYGSSTYFGRRRRRRRSSSGRKRSRTNVDFITADGQRVSFKARRRKRRSSRGTPKHLKKYTNKMKELGRRYRNGEFGNQSWKSVVKTHMKKGGSRKRSRRRRRSRRRY